MKFQDILNKVTKMQLPTVDKLYNSEAGWKVSELLPKNATLCGGR